jgi:hypothetical protein
MAADTAGHAADAGGAVEGGERICAEAGKPERSHRPDWMLGKHRIVPSYPSTSRSDMTTVGSRLHHRWCLQDSDPPEPLGCT